MAQSTEVATSPGMSQLEKVAVFRVELELRSNVGYRATKVDGISDGVIIWAVVVEGGVSWFGSVDEVTGNSGQGRCGGSRADAGGEGSRSQERCGRHLLIS